MDKTIEIVGGSIGVVIMGLSALSRRFPHVSWLQHFRFDAHLSEEQRTRMRRRANVYAGAQMILMGIALPIGYVALTVMFFNDITAKALTLVLAGAVLCIVLGITAIVRSRR